MNADICILLLYAFGSLCFFTGSVWSVLRLL